jgi:hypothetical protein
MSPKKPSLRLFSVIGCKKGVKMSSQLHFLPYFASAAFFLVPKMKSELAICLLTQGTFKKSYRNSRCRRPVVDRDLQKIHVLLMTMPKYNPKYLSL